MKECSAKYDVLICGGGIAGVSCAYNSARLGLKTLLVEKENYLGGDITGALVVPVMKSDASNINNIFYNELVSAAKKQNAQQTYCDNNSGWFNPIILKSVLEQMLNNAGVDILFESQVCEVSSCRKNVSSVKINANILSLPIDSISYVDATGNGSFSKLLNCEFWEDCATNQPASLRFIMSGINLKDFAGFLESIDSDKNITTTYRNDDFIHLSTAYTWDKSQNWALAPYFEDALSKNILKESDLAYFQVFSIAQMPDSLAFNCPRVRDYDIDNPFDYSQALIEAREAILRLCNFVGQYFPGFKKAYISSIASRTGQREIKRVKCVYDYTLDDIIAQKRFENPIVHSNYPIDIHSNKKDASVLYKVCSYMLPIEAVRSKNYNNLYAIGKILGADFKAHSALRVQSSCMSMGEGAAIDIKNRFF